MNQIRQNYLLDLEGYLNVQIDIYSQKLVLLED